jgi:hydrogenase maturation protease
LGALVLGIGNILLRDEGVGVRTVEQLERQFRFPEEVEILDGGTSGMELLPYIRNKEHLILIDAVKGNHPPGTVVRVEGEDVSARFMTRISPHQLGISDVLAAAQLTGELPQHMVLFGIEPKSMETGLNLSQEVKQSLERLISVIVEELSRLGYAIKQRLKDRAASVSPWDHG